MDSPSALLAYFEELGLPGEASQLYLTLGQAGVASALELSRISAFSRTQTYRYLDQLVAHGLVSVEHLSYGSLYTALPIQALHALAEKHAGQAQQLADSFPAVVTELTSVMGLSDADVSTQQYSGLGGLKQVRWHAAKATSDVRICIANQLPVKTEAGFARRCAEQWTAQQTKVRTLTNLPSIFGFDIEPYDSGLRFYRHLESDQFLLDFELYCYDQIVCLVQPRAEKLAITEIQSATLQAIIAKLFDALWANAEPLEIQ